MEKQENNWEWREHNRAKVLQCLRDGEYEDIVTRQPLFPLVGKPTPSGVNAGVLKIMVFGNLKKAGSWKKPLELFRLYGCTGSCHFHLVGFQCRSTG